MLNRVLRITIVVVFAVTGLILIFRIILIITFMATAFSALL